MKLSLLTVLAVCIPICTPAYAADSKTKVLFIGKDRDHPFTTHEYMADCELLARCLRQTQGVETVVSNGWPTDAKALDGVTAIVLHTQKGGNVLFGSPARRQAEELMKKGVGLTAIHWSTGADKGEAGELWLRTLGGWFDLPAKSRYLVRTATVRQTDPKHPICRGWKDYELREEFYVDLHFLPESRPVLAATIDGKEHPIGWVYERPGSNGGRSFGFVGGHFHANFADKPFRQALVNGILWTARVEVPAGGAPCAISAKDMELPPDTRPMKK
jgi:type 1 glutamine amidotransferase